jgi:DNA-binding MarR family transcriptional regulator
MNARATKPALVLGATAMLAFGATGLSGISAQARSSSAGASTQPRTGPGMNTAALAKQLGISQSELETALAAVRTELGTPDRASDLNAEAQAIADSLGVDVSTVTAVLTAQIGDRAKDAAAATTPSATDRVRPTSPAGNGRRGGRGRGPDQARLLAALVKATGKTEAEVRTALAAGRSAHEKLEAARQAKFAALLAERLGLSQATVTAALDAVKPTRPAQAAKTTTGATA